MGSILIRQVPDPVHKDFKKLCQAKKTSMENEMIRLISREVRAAARRKANAPNRGTPRIFGP
jgi:hypothetical protein